MVSGLVNSGSPETTAAAGRSSTPLERAPQAVGIALHHGRGREARLQQPAEGRIEFDQHQPRRIDALLDDCLGHRTGARTELDDRARHVRIEVGRHGAGERLAGRRHGAERQRLLDPGADEADLVVEAEDLLLLEAPEVGLELLLLQLDLLLDPLALEFELLLLVFELLLDLALERALLELEEPDLLSDLAFDNVLLQPEKPDLLFETLFEKSPALGAASFG